jgi:MinD-like ATPase involved in chromosome partitioning or flagellar assembly
VLFGFDETSINLALNDYVWGNTSIENAAYDVTSVLKNKGTENSKLYLVPSSVKVNDIARILREGYNVELLNQGFQNLIKQLDLDYLLIDTHPGLNEETLLSIAMSDIFILILRPDQQDYQGSAVTLDIAQKLEVPKMLLVVNKVPQTLDLVQLQEKVSEAYSTEVAGVLPHSDDLMILASNGIFALQYPEHELSLVLENITKRVISQKLGC